MSPNLRDIEQLARSPNSVSMPSKRLIASYVLDWIVIVIVAAAGGSLQFVNSSLRPFSLVDLSISYPYVPESISIGVVVLVALLAPAIIIAVVTLLLLPAPSISRTLKKADIWRRRLWELHAGLAGLALAVSMAFFITQGLKTIFAKPRPHFLALCDPDLSNIASHVVGGFGQDISARWTLVNPSICQQKDRSMLLDGWRSFPSGHSSFSWSGLLYLTLFASAKFAIGIPYLPLTLTDEMQSIHKRDDRTDVLPLHDLEAGRASSHSKSPDRQPIVEPPPSPTPIYSRSAAPPNYLLLLVCIPLGVAAYITSTRYTEFWHFGFDVFIGAVIGVASAWFSFRWYHLPIPRGQGWAWGARSSRRAFEVGVGVGSYAGEEQ